MAREVYNLHFPYAERNAIKKQLIINSLVFEIHVKLPDIFGEDIPINKRFMANCSSRILTMADFDADSTEQTILLNSGRISKLLRWAVHNLGIFMWPDDYDLLPDPDFDFAPPEDFCEDNDWEYETIFESEEDYSVQQTMPDIYGRVDIEYSNHTAQEIVSVLRMLQYFEPDSEYNEEFV